MQDELERRRMDMKMKGRMFDELEMRDMKMKERMQDELERRRMDKGKKECRMNQKGEGGAGK